MKFEWEKDKFSFGSGELFYSVDTGRIYGKVKVSITHYRSYDAFYEKRFLGEYLTLEQAKTAVENEANIEHDDRQGTLL
jgi:hypothetical protein